MFLLALLLLVRLQSSSCEVVKEIITPKGDGPLCPGSSMIIEYATDGQSLTCEVNDTASRRYLTAHRRDDKNYTKYLQLSNRTNTTVDVQVTAEGIVFRVVFIAREDVNGTVLCCYSEADTVSSKDNTTIFITGTCILRACTSIITITIVQ